MKQDLEHAQHSFIKLLICMQAGLELMEILDGNAAFQDNYRLMETIDEAIGDTITYMIDEGQLKTDEQ